jgi:hypothetical protein
MAVYRSLRVSIFVYDLLRLLGMLWVLPLLILTPQAESGFSFPLFVYTAPNALFLLAVFFLLVRFEEYRSYAYLYIAGKAVAVTANLGWFFFSLRKLAPALAEYALGALAVLGFLLLLACLDALSVLGMSALVMRGLGKPAADSGAAARSGGTGFLPAGGADLPETNNADPAINAETEE